MKRSFVLVTVLFFMPSASADVYVKVDANGNAIGGAIMCDAATCGAGSQYSQLTLQEGERYVLQGVGVHHGIGNNNPDTGVKHDDRSNEWVITRNESQPAPVVERFTVITPAPTPALPQEPQIKPIVTETQTVQSDTRTVTIDTATVLSDSATVVSVDAFDWDAFWLQFETLFGNWFRMWGRL